VADTVEIPDREWFKASEVCEIASVQPYVLRSWELEFPALGVAKSAGGTRSYRRADVERVLRIKQLVFVEGLTLAGARRRIDGDEPSDSFPEPAPAVSGEARQKLDGIKKDLRALLDLMDKRGGTAKAATWPPRSQPTLLELEPGAAPEDGNGRKPAPKKRAPRSK
jgi:DNA-binding transcriptional MerR regulator